MEIKSTSDMRGFLLEQMQSVADGSQEVNQAKAICNYAQQIYNTLNMELRYAQAKSKLGDTVVAAVDFMK